MTATCATRVPPLARSFRVGTAAVQNGGKGQGEVPLPGPSPLTRRSSWIDLRNTGSVWSFRSVWRNLLTGRTGPAVKAWSRRCLLREIQAPLPTGGYKTVQLMGGGSLLPGPMRCVERRKAFWPTCGKPRCHSARRCILPALALANVEKWACSLAQPAFVGVPTAGSGMRHPGSARNRASAMGSCTGNPSRLGRTGEGPGLPLSLYSAGSGCSSLRMRWRRVSNSRSCCSRNSASWRS